nr:SDR family oxidoreductase [Micromonospora sp. ATCC 39149]
MDSAGSSPLTWPAATTAGWCWVGRSPLTADGQAVLAALRGGGAADAVYLSADVADPAAARDLVARLRQRYGGTHVLVHAAGVLDPRPLTDVDDSGLAATLRPKMTGVLALDEATRDEDLDAVVLFSSAAAVLGDFGLGGYGVANRFLDAFGEWREARRAAGQRRGATAVLNWPLWADGGMHLPGEDLYLRSTGVVPLSTTDGLDILDLALARGWSQTVVLPAAAAGDQPPVGAVPVGAGTVQSGGASDDAPDDWPERLRSEVRAVAAEVLRFDADRLVPDENLSAFGFDSLSLKTYAQRLTDVFGVPVSPTLFFARGTLREVADHLADRHGAALRARYATAHLPADPAPHAMAAPPVHPVSAPAPVLAEGTAAGARGGAPEPPSGGPQPVALTRPRSAEPTPSGASRGGAPIAVVGMAGRFPGSPDLAAYWRNLVAGRDLIAEVPADRWDWRAVDASGGDTEGRSRSRWGGFIGGADHFDAAFFRISRREAELIDPQHRIFLETAWAALEDAGWSTTTLAGRRVGVFAGVQFREYGQLLEEAGIRVAQIGTGNEHAMLPNRLSYLLDVRGPSEAIDTACSGSLVAVHRAIRSLRSGESELAVAGGVSLMLTPRYHILTTQMGVASPTGRCRTFSANADGYVRGEGVGVVVLKPLERALTDGDHVYAVLRGSAVGHGGRASSPTAPNSRAQADLVLAAWDDAGVDAADISYVEAHGTGTELGDPVEVEGLREAFEEAGRRGGPRPVPGGCGLGSVKSQIGHLEPAAGIAGLIKVVLALRHGTLPGDPARQPAQPVPEPGREPVPGGRPGHAVAAPHQPWRGDAAASGGPQLVRLRWHQRPRGTGGARHGAGRRPVPVGGARRGALGAYPGAAARVRRPVGDLPARHDRRRPRPGTGGGRRRAQRRPRRRRPGRAPGRAGHGPCRRGHPRRPARCRAGDGAASGGLPTRHHRAGSGRPAARRSGAGRHRVHPGHRTGDAAHPAGDGGRRPRGASRPAGHVHRDRHRPGRTDRNRRHPPGRRYGGGVRVAGGGRCRPGRYRSGEPGAGLGVRGGRRLDGTAVRPAGAPADVPVRTRSDLVRDHRRGIRSPRRVDRRRRVARGPTARRCRGRTSAGAR